MKKKRNGNAGMWGLILLLLLHQITLAQNKPLLDIDSCYVMAKNNYPLIRQYGLLSQAADFNISNASKAYLPQVSLTGIGAYIFSGFPGVSSPGSPAPEDSKLKFLGIAQVNQTIWDGGVVKAQKEMIRANENVEKNSVDVSLYAVRERVNQLYFGVLLIDAQLNQMDVLVARYELNLQNIIKSKENGYAYQSDVDEIKAEILSLEQKKIEFRYARKGYLEMLSYLIGRPLQGEEQLAKPIQDSLLNLQQNNRPELSLFASQHTLIETQFRQNKANNMPKLGLLGAGILIEPGAHFGSTSLTSLALAGLSLSWNTGNLYRSSNNKQLNKIQLDKLSTEEETFRFNNNMQLQQASADIEKERAILKKDEEIVALKATIKQSYQLKYDNGLCPMADLITAMNRESEAKSNQSLHEVQLMMSLYNRKTINGN